VKGGSVALDAWRGSREQRAACGRVQDVRDPNAAFSCVPRTQYCEHLRDLRCWATLGSDPVRAPAFLSLQQVLDMLVEAPTPTVLRCASTRARVVAAYRAAQRRTARGRRGARSNRRRHVEARRLSGIARRLSQSSVWRRTLCCNVTIMTPYSDSRARADVGDTLNHELVALESSKDDPRRQLRGYSTHYLPESDHSSSAYDDIIRTRRRPSPTRAYRTDEVATCRWLRSVPNVSKRLGRTASSRSSVATCVRHASSMRRHAV